MATTPKRTLRPVQLQRTPVHIRASNAIQDRLAYIVEAIETVDAPYITFRLRARGPKNLKSTLLLLARGEISMDPKDKDGVAPLAGRTNGKGFAWKRGKGANAVVLLRVPKEDANGWARSLVSMEQMPSNSRVEIQGIESSLEFFSAEDKKGLSLQRTNRQLEIIGVAEKTEKFIIIPSSKDDHSDHSSGEDFVVTVASNSESESDPSRVAATSLRDRSGNRTAHLLAAIDGLMTAQARKALAAEHNLEQERLQRQEVTRQLEEQAAENKILHAQLALFGVQDGRSDVEGGHTAMGQESHHG